MAFTRAWRNFKRMQDITVVAASLIFAAGAADAFDRLPGGHAQIARWTLLWPAAYLGFSMGVPLLVPAIRRWLARYVWMSFQAGFGQTAVSILSGVALLMGAGLFMHWQVVAAAASGRVGANVFSAFGAGIGILAAQAILVRALEALPDVQKVITERGSGT